VPATALGDGFGPQLAALAAATLRTAENLELMFVTSLRATPLTDRGPSGLSSAAQHYTRREADEIIRSFRDLGITVTPCFSEREFIDMALERVDALHTRQLVVYTTAEGGTGSGRRALIPALCNLLGLSIVNSGAHACALARHKLHANAIMAAAGVRVPATWQFSDGRWASDQAPPLGARVIVKPCWEGMSIGVDEDSVTTVDAVFSSAIAQRNREFGQPAIVQEFVSGEEVAVPLLRIGATTIPLPPVAFRRADGTRFGERPKTFRVEVLDHDTSFATFETTSAMCGALQSAAVRAFDALEMRGAGRIDFRVDADGRAWAFDSNESPPPLRNTSYAFAMSLLGLSLDEMLALWLAAALPGIDDLQDSDQKDSSARGSNLP
jgi:D-alanine-D-alanine ligase-like ATP-grasp enzyme